MKSIILKSSGIVLFLFGLLNLFIPFSIIFDLFHLRIPENNYIFFLAIIDLVCGVLYLYSGYGLFRGKIWTTKFLFSTAFILIFTFTIFMIYIISGGDYDEKIFIAIPIRTFITLIFTLISWNYITRKINFNDTGFK